MKADSILPFLQLPVAYFFLYISISFAAIQIPYPRTFSSQASKDTPGPEVASVEVQKPNVTPESKPVAELAKPAQKAAKTDKKGGK